MFGTSGSDVNMFKRSQKQWLEIDQVNGENLFNTEHLLELRYIYIDSILMILKFKSLKTTNSKCAKSV